MSLFGKTHTIPEIISAIQTITTGCNPDDYKTANDVIMEWKSSSQCLIQSIQIAVESEEDNVVFTAGCVAHECIVSMWNQCPQNLRVNIRNTICSKLLNFKGTSKTRGKLIEMIVAIGLKDWPEEWSDFLSGFINSAADSPEICILDFEIIADLITEIHSTETITNQRRKQLIDEFDKSTPELLAMTNWAIQNIDFQDVGLNIIKCLKALCLTAPKAILLVDGFIKSLFTIFVMNETTHEVGIETVINLLIKRTDAHEIVNDNLDEIIEIINEIINIGIPPLLVTFLIQFLTEYGSNIEEMCYGDESIDEELINWTLTIYRLILSNPPIEEHNEDFWYLWRTILYRYYRASKSNNKFDLLQPCIQMYQNLIPEIRESLYIGSQSAGEGGKLKSINCQTCWIFLTSIDKKGMIEFLSSRQPSTSMCYALGLIDACLSNQEEYKLLIQILPILFGYQAKSQSIDFGVALLYALSHCIRFLNQESTFLEVFGGCLLNFLNSENNTVRSASVNALYYVSFRRPLLLCKPPTPVYDGLSRVIGDMIAKFDFKHSVKLCKSLASIASAQTIESIIHDVYDLLFSSISQLTSSNDTQSVVNGLQIINEITKMKLNNGDIIFSQFVDLLIPMIKEIMVNNESYFTLVAETMTSVIDTFDFETIKMIIDQFVGILLQLPQFKDASLIIFSSLRKHFIQMEVFYQMIKDKFIQNVLPNLSKTRVEAFSILKFFKKFSIHIETIGILLEISVHFVTDERIEVSKEAAKLLRKIILYLYENQTIDDLVNERMQIMGALFSSLTDTFHQPIFNSLSKALNSYIQAITSSTYSMTSFDNDVATILKGLTNNNEMLLNFSKYLRTNALDIGQFSSGIREFLVSIKCASRSDKNLFKYEIKLDKLTDELLNLVSNEEKDAIKAEEVETLPDLANLTLALSKF